MPAMKIIMDGDGCWPDLKLGGRPVIHTTDPIEVALLRGGMKSGKASVGIRINLEDGRTVIAETSLALFTAAADAFRARLDEETKGGGIPQ